MSASSYDVAVVGGGPAGLGAAFWLARYRRRVRVVDFGDPRNRTTWAVHGYPGLPDVRPDEFRRRLRDQAVGAGAEVCSGRVTHIAGERDHFDVSLDDGSSLHARRILLAYGLRDEMPPLPGLEDAYGTSVFHCPDCDGPSMVGACVAVYGHDRAAAALALYLLTWADRITLLTDAHPPAYDDQAAATLRGEGIAVRQQRIVRLDAPGGRLRLVELEHGDPVRAEAFFFHLAVVPGSDLAARFGCHLDAAGQLVLDSSQETSRKGIFAAGDLVGPPFLACTAAASGVRVALALHRSLLPPKWRI